MIRDQLQRILATGSLNLGEVNVRRITDTLFSVRHWRDTELGKAGRSVLQIYTNPTAACDLARFDREGRYRPLKGAPTLPTGWELQLDSIDALRRHRLFLSPGRSLVGWRGKKGEFIPSI